MTTSRTPWSIRPCEKTDATLLIDADGETIALFRDHRDADLVLGTFGSVADFEKTIEGLEETVAAIKDLVNTLKAERSA